MTLRLYCFGESGNAYKAALALELSGLDWEAVVAGAVAAVPQVWLEPEVAAWGSVDAVRAAYRRFLISRVESREVWLPALVAAVAQGPARDDVGHRVTARRSPGPPDWIPELKIGRAEP